MVLMMIEGMRDMIAPDLGMTAEPIYTLRDRFAREIAPCLDWDHPNPKGSLEIYRINALVRAANAVRLMREISR